MSAITRWTLKWEHGDATIQSLGAMLGPVRFELGRGRSISPLWVAPWGDDAQWPGLMRALRGEWPCVPFGAVHAPIGLPQGFERQDPSDDWNHGYGSNHPWQLVEQTSHMFRLRIDYPDNGEIESLERVIKANPDEPTLDVSLTVRVRREAVLPIALHPTFAVPAEGVEIVGCSHQAIHTYPAPTEPGVSKILPDRTAASLTALPTEAGSIDMTRLPLTVATEEILQMAGCQPPFVLRYPASGADVLLDWNVEDLPDALLWISNGGRSQAPWCGRNFALGVEPANSFFDLGRVVVPPASNPLAMRSGLRFFVDHPRTISYRLSVRAM